MKYLLGFFSVLWLGLGTLWLSNIACGGSDAPVFSVQDGSFMTQSTDMFGFNRSSDKTITNANMSKAFKKVATHLKDNSNKMLALTGSFASNEKNNTDFEDLGVARAESIKEILNKLGAPAEQITTTSKRSDNLSFSKKKVMLGGVDFLFSAADDASNSGAGSGSLDDESEATGSSVIFSEGSPMNLNISSADFDLNDNNDFQTYVEGLAAYITDNPKKKILITAFNEDSSKADDIGREVRSYLKKKLGLSTKQFSRDAKDATDSPSGEAMVTVGIK